MQKNLQQLKQQALDDLDSVNGLEDLKEIELKYFGRKQGKLNEVLKLLSGLSAEDKKNIGQLANQIKKQLESAFELKRRDITKHSDGGFNDLTEIHNVPSGHLHPVTQIRREIEAIFRQMGFAVMTGPEIETDYYNFESLNMPIEHPARDMWDTFYLKSHETNSKDKLVLRTHISPMQVRVMEKMKPPFAVISSGRVFRREATDARHEHTYDYTEGFMVGENISMANLKFVLLNLFRQLFGKNVNIKLRASYFPFTEPSIELLMGCIFCKQKGCPVCHTGWLEMLGAGMIHPGVFEYAGYPKGKYSGFAFGIGISRVAMLKYNIPDIRLLYQNDQRLLNQF